MLIYSYSFKHNFNWDRVFASKESDICPRTKVNGRCNYNGTILSAVDKDNYMLENLILINNYKVPTLVTKQLLKY